MVARIIFGEDINGAVAYNELKVSDGTAACLDAPGFGRDSEDLSMKQKLVRFQDLVSRNQRVTTNTMHISLNFHPSEVIDEDTARLIASDYMDRIGFGDQPYLLYAHYDAAHPHLHIVTTNIKANGKPINTYMIGKYLSDPARVEIEKAYGLIPAQGRGENLYADITALDVDSLQYGEMETKKAISNVVRKVVQQFKFASLQELNAILKQFNVCADPGSPGSRRSQYRGLVYSMLDRYGQKVGRQIKASSIYGKPTLQNLEAIFKKKEGDKRNYRGRTSRVIEDCLKISSDREIFAGLLKQAGVRVVFHQNEDGLTYGITFVDIVTKTVFKGSDLRKDFSVGRIMARLEKNNDPYYLHNVLFIASLIAKTNAARRPFRILQSWKKAGLVIAASQGATGKIHYRLGHFRSPAASWVPAPSEIAKWLELTDISRNLLPSK